MFQLFDKRSCGVWLLPLALMVGTLGCSAPPPPEAIAPTVTPSASTPTASPAASPTAEASPSSTALDITLRPGERVGPVTATTRYGDLVEIFGQAALEDINVSMGEGFMQAGTRVTPTPDGEDGFTVVWRDEARSGVDQVREFGPVWQLPGGIGIGTSFATLQAQLGPFQLYGFAWDYGGTLELAGTSLEASEGLVVLRVGPRNTENPPPLPDTVVGDALFPSDHPDLPGLDLVVEEMIVFLQE